VYDGIPYQVKQRAGDRGITAENMENSQHTDFNEDTTNESASVARIWQRTTVKAGLSERMKKRVWTPLRWKDWERFCGFRGQQRKQWWVPNKAGVKRELLEIVKSRKLAYYGHTMRKQGSCPEKEIMQKKQFQVHAGEEGNAQRGWTSSGRGQDSPWKSQSEWQRTEINGERMSMVWPILGSRTAKEQNRTPSQLHYITCSLTRIS